MHQSCFQHRHAFCPVAGSRKEVFLRVLLQAGVPCGAALRAVGHDRDSHHRGRHPGGKPFCCVLVKKDFGGLRQVRIALYAL